MIAHYEKRLFNVDQYYRMAEVGIFEPEERVELIEGEIIKKFRITPPHAANVTKLGMVLTQRLDSSAIVSNQNPIRLNEWSEPEPDISLLLSRDDFYADHHPGASEVLLVIEVADSSLDYDRNIKLPLYAKFGIPEVWIADLLKDRIEAYSEPVNGTYQKCRIVGKGQSISPEKLPMFVFAIKELLA